VTQNVVRGDEVKVEVGHEELVEVVTSQQLQRAADQAYRRGLTSPARRDVPIAVQCDSKSGNQRSTPSSRLQLLVAFRARAPCRLSRGARSGRPYTTRPALLWSTGRPHAAATEIAATLKSAHELRASLNAKDFSPIASQRGGGDFGWLDQGDLPEQLEDALLALEPGQISTPVRGPSGVHISLLRERQTGGVQIPPFEEAKDGIYRELLDRAMAKQQELFLADLGRNAVIDSRL
jgi:PPIC-type PPIASE domain